jgi:hypothetical protein
MPQALWPQRCCLPGLLAAQVSGKRLRVAAVLTEFTHRSHAHVILENFLEPYYFNGQLTDSEMDVVAMYVDQTPEGRDMSVDTGKAYNIPIYPTIAEALRCGGSELAVDAVLSIGEHGNYPTSERGQVMYPRKRFFDEIVAVFRKDGRSVPVFNDKHLSYRWDWAHEMVEVSRELKFPFMAGSSVPFAERQPPVELPENAVVEEAVSIHSGNLEGYDFHALEVLQSIVEARRGGESGVAEVQLLEGDAVWKAADEGRWNLALGEAALRTGPDADAKSLRDFVEPADGQKHAVHAVLVRYCDGMKAAVLRIGSSATRWKFACKLAGQKSPIATSFYVGPWENRNLFKALSHAIQTHFRNQQAPCPIERTLLVTGVVAAAMDSRFEKNAAVPTPHLNFGYQPRDFRAMREMGASWKIITEDQPQPDGINPGGPRPERKS